MALTGLLGTVDSRPGNIQPGYVFTAPIVLLDITVTATLDPRRWTATLEPRRYAANLAASRWAATLDQPRRWNATIDPRRWEGTLP